MTNRQLSITAGASYLVIFFAAIFANFFMLDAVKQNPLMALTESPIMVRLGVMAFLITVVFDVVVAWALYELYKNNILSRLSTYFRMMHAMIFGAGVFALPLMFSATTDEAVLHQVEVFNNLWLIGLFFFGIHLILLAKILQKPKAIMWLITLAGIMYMVDTTAHFTMTNYAEYAGLFLALVATPSILGEMSLTIWLLVKGGK